MNKCNAFGGSGRWKAYISTCSCLIVHCAICCFIFLSLSSPVSQLLSLVASSGSSSFVLKWTSAPWWLPWLASICQYINRHFLFQIFGKYNQNLNYILMKKTSLLTNFFLYKLLKLTLLLDLCISAHFQHNHHVLTVEDVTEEMSVQDKCFYGLFVRQGSPHGRSTPDH